MTMATTVSPTRSRTSATAGAKRPRVRESAAGSNGAGDSREQKYDLLTAALLGLAIGAGTTLLLRRGPSGGRPIGPAWRMAKRGAKVGARYAGMGATIGAKYAGRGARYAWDRGVDAWESIPREEIEDRMRDYFESARDVIENTVENELKDLRRAIRRRRKKLGL
jgi:hypothetical protein